MVDATGQIKCGQIFILSNKDFALVCEFCGQGDYCTLEEFRSHIKFHLPEYDDEVCISSDSDCEYVPPATEVQFDACAADNLLKERDWVPKSLENELSDGSIENYKSEITQRKRNHKKSSRTIPSPRANGNISVASVGLSSRTKPLKTWKSTNCTDDMNTEITAEMKISEDLDYTPNETRYSRTKKSFPCRFCHKLLTSSISRLDHENIHTGDRPHKCKICRKAFISTSAVFNHVKLIHKRDYRHACSVCDKKFFYPNRLDNHFREKHLPDSDPRRFFQCKQCVKKFISILLLRKHIRHDHKIASRQYERKSAVSPTLSS